MAEKINKPYSLAVRAVIFDDAGRCLLIRRSSASRHSPGTWEWPGGKADRGESFPEALAREVREEVGLEIELIGLAGATELEMPDVRVVLLCMEARAVGGEVRLSAEHDRFLWLPITGIKTMPLAHLLSPFMLKYAERKQQETREETQ